MKENFKNKKEPVVYFKTISKSKFLEALVYSYVF